MASDFSISSFGSIMESGEAPRRVCAGSMLSKVFRTSEKRPILHTTNTPNGKPRKFFFRKSPSRQITSEPTPFDLSPIDSVSSKARGDGGDTSSTSSDLRSFSSGSVHSRGLGQVPDFDTQDPIAQFDVQRAQEDLIGDYRQSDYYLASSKDDLIPSLDVSAGNTSQGEDLHREPTPKASNSSPYLSVKDFDDCSFASVDGKGDRYERIICDDHQSPNAKGAAKRLETVAEDCGVSPGSLSTISSKESSDKNEAPMRTDSTSLDQMRQMILDQQASLQELLKKNEAYEQQLVASNERLQHVEKDHEAAKETLSKMQLERESFQAEANWFREELKAVRKSSYGVMPLYKQDHNEIVSIPTPTQEATSKVLWIRTQPLALGGQNKIATLPLKASSSTLSTQTDEESTYCPTDEETSTRTRESSTSTSHYMPSRASSPLDADSPNTSTQTTSHSSPDSRVISKELDTQQSRARIFLAKYNTNDAGDSCASPSSRPAVSEDNNRSKSPAPSTSSQPASVLKPNYARRATSSPRKVSFVEDDCSSWASSVMPVQSPTSWQYSNNFMFYDRGDDSPPVSPGNKANEKSPPVSPSVDLESPDKATRARQAKFFDDDDDDEEGSKPKNKDSFSLASESEETTVAPSVDYDEVNENENDGDENKLPSESSQERDYLPSASPLRFADAEKELRWVRAQQKVIDLIKKGVASKDPEARSKIRQGPLGIYSKSSPKADKNQLSEIYKRVADLRATISKMHLDCDLTDDESRAISTDGSKFSFSSNNDSISAKMSFSSGSILAISSLKTEVGIATDSDFTEPESEEDDDGSLKDLLGRLRSEDCEKEDASVQEILSPLHMNNKYRRNSSTHMMDSIGTVGMETIGSI